MKMQELDNMTDRFVYGLICEGVWVKRDGLDLEIKTTPYSISIVLNLLNEFGINVKHNITNIEDESINIKFSKMLNKALPLQSISIEYKEETTDLRMSA